MEGLFGNKAAEILRILLKAVQLPDRVVWIESRMLTGALSCCSIQLFVQYCGLMLTILSMIFLIFRINSFFPIFTTQFSLMHDRCQLQEACFSIVHLFIREQTRS